MILLGKPRVSGTFALSDANAAPTKLVIVPENAGFPAEISVRNNGAAIVYLKWREIGAGVSPTTSDYGVVLGPNEAYTWNNPPRGAELVGQSTVNGSPVAVEANWTDVEFLS